MSNQLAPRPLHVIAREIVTLWPDPWFGAVPYIEAMRHLVGVDDSYGMDRGRDIVLHFLSNAKTWRGDDAARIKNELRVMIGQKPVKPRAAKPAAPKATDAEKAQRKADAAIVRAAASRAIFCPYTGVIMDMRRTVVVIQGSGSRSMDATKWDEIKDQFFAHIGPEVAATVTVLDGRELFTPGGRVRA